EAAQRLPLVYVQYSAYPSGGIIGRRLRKERMDGCCLLGSPDLRDDIRIAQHACNARQRLEVIRTSPFRSQKQEDQIHGLVVQRLEIDRCFQPREDACDALDAGQLAMRDGDAVANTGRTELFALQDGVEDFPLRKSGDRSGFFRKQLKELLLG